MKSVSLPIVAIGCILILLLQFAEVSGWLPDLLAPSPTSRVSVVDDLVCGPRSLHIALNLLGVPVTPDEVIQQCKVTSSGVSFGDLAAFAMSKGLTADLETLNWSRVATERAIYVLFVDNGHYVALDTRNGPGSVRVFDPGHVAKTIGPDWLDGRWDGESLKLRNEKTSSSALQFESCWHDAGFVTDDILSFRVKVKNRGSQPAKLVVSSTSCNCAGASFEPDTIEPGNEAYLLASVDLSRKRGHFEETIDVASSTGAGPVQVWLTGGKFATSLARKKEFIGEVIEGDEFRFELYVHDPGDESLSLDKDDISVELGFEENDQVIAAKVEVSKLDASDEMIGIRSLHSLRPGDYRITLVGDLPSIGCADRVKGHVSIETTLPKPLDRCEIVLDGQVLGRVACSPAGVVAPLNEREFVLSFKDRLGTPLEYITSECAIPGIRIDAVSHDTEGEFELKIAFTEASRSSLRSPSSISVETSLGSITVPVFQSQN